jgi:uncharacterized membrane protein YcaP (DUF421 family)
MRLMGKRQIGELEVSDLVTTILISEIASLPITNTSVPLSHAIIPTATLLSFEVISSFLIAKYPRVKNLLTDRPSILIKKGSFCKKAMLDARISTDELIGELRQQGITDPAEVLYAILEQNGKITVIPKEEFRTPTLKQLGIEPKKSGLYHIIIDRGVVNKHALAEFAPFKQKINSYMSSRSIAPRDIYIMMISDAGEIEVILKEDMK